MENINIILTKEEIINLVENKIKKPHRFFKEESNIKILIRYLLFDKYKYTTEEIPNKFNRQFIINNGMYTLLTTYRYTVSGLLNLAVPELDIKSWQLRFVPENFWDNKENVSNFIKYIFEKDFNSDKKLLARKFNTVYLFKNNYRSIYYAMSVIEMLDITFPGEFIQISSNRRIYKGDK